jgi:predicted sulfurtransferase
MVARHRAALADLDVKGRIWISAQGINTQAGGPAADVQRYADWVAAQPEFQGLR